ncbi:MAG: DUF4089 domain-containing protein [Pantoea sp. Brub]|nr:DUF4089 domain-containing protein [Pantoea sp. Brub]
MVVQLVFKTYNENTMQNTINWQVYILHMQTLLNLTLDEINYIEVINQMEYLSNIAKPLMLFPIEERLAIAGVYKA